MINFSHRKKQGQKPTGVLCHKAKETGYSSVSKLLHANGPENDIGASPKKKRALEKV